MQSTNAMASNCLLHIREKQMLNLPEPIAQTIESRQLPSPPQVQLRLIQLADGN